MPAALQRRVHAEVEQTKARSGWPATKTLQVLGISRGSYYRWLREAKWARERERAEPLRPVQAYEALAEEKAAVLAYARKHAGLRHRELAWRMVDEEVACLSASTVYRILKEANLVCPWRRRTKRRRGADEKATRPDQRWSTDLMHLKVAGREYYLVCFLDEYSRYIVHHELLLGMDGQTVSVAAQAAIERLPRGVEGRRTEAPEIRSDNGSGFVSVEFRGVLKEHGLGHHRIKPHCPEENGLIERAYRTVREALEGEELRNLLQAEEVLSRIVGWYNEERLHSALGYLRPVDYYRGDPHVLGEERRRKLRAARQRRKEINLGIGQRTMGFSAGEVVA
ncbi:MAG: IS3 family transposase [Acidobacteria bacterium]|nr:IS3 family transposase [Acidobacteriota bacterium]